MKTPSWVKLGIVAAAFAGSALVPVAGNAAEINSLLVVGENSFEDRDVERVMRLVPGTEDVAPVTSGPFMVGDVIQTILRFTGIAPGTGSGTTISDYAGFGAPYQLLAYAELLVAAIVNPDLTPCAGPVCTLIFAPAGNLGANVFAEVYEKTAVGVGYDEAIDPDAAIAAVRDETLVATVGIGDIDDFWAATTLLDLTAAAGAVAGSGQAANGILGLSFLSGSIPFIPNGTLRGALGSFHDLVGDASAFAKQAGANAGWLVASNTTVTFNVPEPGTLALLGLALLGAGAFKRRRA